MNDITRAADPPATRPAAPSAGAPSLWRGTTLLTVVGIVLLSLNLRAAITALAPVLSEVRADLGLSRGAAGLLTTVPVLCFGLLSPAMSGLGRRWGSERVLGAALLAIAAGVVVRSTDGFATALLGTMVLGAAITAGNVLVPAVIKEDFPHAIGPVMGLFTASLTGGAALAAALSGPIVDGLGAGWRLGLAAWALLALAAFAVWVPQLRKRAVPAVSGHGVRVWRTPVAWWLAAFMSAQGFTYYALVAWMPTLLEEHGVSSGAADLALTLYNLLGIPSALVLPAVAGRMRRQRLIGALIAVAWAIGIVGLLVAPGGYLLWASIAGVAQGGGISMAVTLVVLRASTPAVARSLSGMVQGVGYAVSAAGPLVLGALRDVAGSWTVPLLVLCGAVLIEGVAGFRGGRDIPVG